MQEPIAAPLQIQIVSDPVCPWCYVGKRRLEQALAARPALPVEIRWLPFQLSPDLPREGRDREAHYAAIFGPERAQTIRAQMQATGAAEGLRFETRPGARSPNTLLAHVLLHLAGLPDARAAGVDQSALAEQLFAAHHTHSEDLGDPAVLARLAGEAGMDPVAVERRLRAGTDEPEVTAMIAAARESGVSGVPFFIFGGRYGLSGAQPVTTLVEVLDRLQAEADPA